MTNLLKTFDFVKKIIDLLNKTYDFVKTIDLLTGTNDFTKNDKFANKEWKGVTSEKIEVFPLVCSKYLSSWTGLGKSRHVRSQSFNQSSHIWVQNLFFSKFLNDSAWF